MQTRAKHMNVCVASSFMLDSLTIISNTNFRNCIQTVRELLSYLFIVRPRFGKQMILIFKMKNDIWDFTN